MRALDRQVGGGHYKDMPLQPIEYIMKNNLGFCEGNVVKYITRYSSKGGVEDLRKVIHYTELLIESLTNAESEENPAEVPGNTSRSKPGYVQVYNP